MKKKINAKIKNITANCQPSSSNIHCNQTYLNFTAGWTNGSVANPHQVGEQGSIPCPAKMTDYPIKPIKGVIKI